MLKMLNMRENVHQVQIAMTNMKLESGQRALANGHFSQTNVTFSFDMLCCGNSEID